MAKARAVRIDPAGPFRDAAAATIAVRVPEMLEYRAGTLEGSDIEELHSMRVATRRLRAALEVYESCFPRRRHRRLLRLVKDTADALSEARDLDVQIDFLETFARGVPAADRPGIESLVARLRRERAAADAHLAPALARLDAEDVLGQARQLARRAEGP
jgi:CHAD domain-containing protein